MTVTVNTYPRIDIPEEARVHDVKLPELPLEPVEPGKTRLKDGSVINSLNRTFVLAPSKENPKIFGFGPHDKTLYTRDRNGTIRRLTPKKGKR